MYGINERVKFQKDLIEFYANSMASTLEQIKDSIYAEREFEAMCYSGTLEKMASKMEQAARDLHTLQKEAR